MSEQPNLNTTPKQICDLVIRYLQGRKKYNVDDNFKKNLLEILQNPSSSYHDKTHLFSEIPVLEIQKNDILREKEEVKKELEDLYLKLNGKEGVDGLKVVVAELENKKNSLVKKIEGDDNSEDEESKKGLEKIVNELDNLRLDLETQIEGDEELESEDKKNGLRKTVELLREKKTDLEKAIDGDLNSQDTLLQVGLQQRKDQLEKTIHGDSEEKQDENKRIGLIAVRNNLTKKIEELTDQNSVVQDLAGFKAEAIQNRDIYVDYVIRTIGVILLSSVLAYWYGNDVFEDLTKIQNIDHRDYFGVFMLKLPFSLMIVTFISGGFVFITKLLSIIERINNQLRNISQISVIASQIDDRTITLIKNYQIPDDEHEGTREEIKREGLQEAEEDKKTKTLFYKLIANYLVSLGKNELELKERKGFNLGNIKDMAEIFNKFGFNKNS